jgi:hypothetical protein
LTANGRVAVRRRWWHAPTIGSLCPADDWLDAGERVSPAVREMACRLNNHGTSFDRVAENLARTAQVSLSGEQLRQLVLAEGQRVLAVQQAAAIPTAFQARDCRVGPQADSPTRIYTGSDGVMVPLITEAEKRKRRQAVCRKRQRRGRRGRPLPPRKKGSDLPFKEFKVVTFYDERARHWHEVLSRGKRRTLGALVRREAKRLGFAEADERIANIDGATWIRHQLQEQPLPLDGLGLDFFHLAENVHRARRAVYGDENPAGQEWAGQLLHTLKHQGYETARDQLLAWIGSLRGRKRQAAGRLLNYVVDRREMINYPEFQAKGWQIGSGPTESRCKTSTHRLKGRGRRWDGRNAEAVAALTTLEDSRQWQLYWQTPCPTKT